MTATLKQGMLWEDTGIVLMARVVGWDNTEITQADVTSIATTIIDLSDESTVTTASETVSSVVYDTLQTDARWTEDSTGYNFRKDAPASWFPDGGRKYRVEFLFTPTSGEAYLVSYELDSRERLAG